MHKTERPDVQVVKYESEAIAGRAVFSAAFALLGIVAIVLLVLAFAISNLDTWNSDESAEQIWKQASTSPGVQPNQAYSRIQREDQIRKQLSSYNWRDSDNTNAQIPLKRAMQLMIDQDLRQPWKATEDGG